MYKVIITEPAESDITEAARYIAKELQNLPAANKLLDDIDNAVTSLKKMPKRYPLVENDYLASLGFRFLSVRNFLIFYIVREDAQSVTIERLLYGRRNWIHIIGK